MLDKIKKQEIGEASTGNIQAGRDFIGLTYPQVKEVALDIFKANFFDLTAQAQAIVTKRATEFIDDYLKIAEKKKINTKEVENPDFQYVMYTAQREYARNGSQDLKEVLINLIIERTNENKRSLKQIVLNEAIETIPKLTSSQLDMISISFLINYTQNNKVNNLNSFYNYLNKYFSFYDNKTSTNFSNIQHLEFLGCGSYESILTKNSLETIFRNQYWGIFCKGFKKEDFYKKFQDLKDLDEVPIVKCINNKELFQINTLNKADLEKNLKFKKEEIDKLDKFQDFYVMNLDEIKNLIIANFSHGEALFNYWTKSKLSSFNLTSVGIAIAIANLERKIGVNFNLSIWITE